MEIKEPSAAIANTPPPPNEKEKLLNSAIINPESTKNFSREQLEICLQEIKNQPDYVRYQSQRINFETLDSLLEDFDDQVSDSSSEESGLWREKLRELIQEIKRGVHDYYDIIIAMDNSEVKKHHMEEFEYREWLTEKDHSRRRIHNALISNLTILTRLINTKIKKIGVEIPKNKLFDGNELRDREYVGKWAINTQKGAFWVDLSQKLEDVLEKKKAGTEISPAHERPL